MRIRVKGSAGKWKAGDRRGVVVVFTMVGDEAGILRNATIRGCDAGATGGARARGRTGGDATGPSAGTRDGDGVFAGEAERAEVGTDANAAGEDQDPCGVSGAARGDRAEGDHRGGIWKDH